MTLPLVLSIGDPAGVGPELACAAWALSGTAGLPPFFVVGSRRVIEEAGERRGLHVRTRAIASPAEVAAVFDTALPVL